VIQRTGRPNFVLKFKWPQGTEKSGKVQEQTTRIPATDRNRRAAQREADRLERELNRQVGPQTPWETFRGRYEREHLSGLADKTRAAWGTARRHLERSARPPLQHLEQVDATEISTFVAYLRHRRGRPIEETTIACYVKTLLAALGWAERIGMLAEAPRFKLPKRAGGKVSGMRSRPITEAEFAHLLATVEDCPHAGPGLWRFYLRGLWFSGLRLGESVALSWEFSADFSIDNLDAQVPCYRILAAGQKSGRDQVLPVAPEFAELLRSTDPVTRHGTVFKLGRSANEVGRTVSAIGRAAKIVVNESTGKCVTAHDLRRSFATRWAARLQPAELQALMRHKSIETTMRYYIRHTAEDLGGKLWGQVGQ